MTATATPRGTKTSKSTTKALQPGDVVLTNVHSGVATLKNGSFLRVVAGKRMAAPEPYQRQARTIVDFTDGTWSGGCTSSQTWMVAALAPADVEEPVIVKAGEAAPLAQHEAPRETPASAGNCACSCGGSTRGGQFLPGHDAKLASRLVMEVREGRLTVETALAQVPAKNEKLVAKVAARINALPQP